MSPTRCCCLQKTEKRFVGFMAYAAVLFLFSMPDMYSSAARPREQRTRTIVRLNDVDNCHDRPIRPYHFTSRKISVIGRDLYVADANATCDKPTLSLEGFVVNITKCSDRTKSNCEHFKRIEWKGSSVLCHMIDSKITPWESIMSSFNPRLACKNDKGPVVVRNLTIDFERFSKLNFELSDYYVFRGEVFDEGKSPFSCMVFEIDFLRTRERIVQ